MLDSWRVDALKLRFDDNGTELPLGPGMHGIGRGGDDAIGLVIDPQAPLLRFCVDRRGVWLAVSDGVRGIHVNGRPVRRMAMLRPGDAIHVDGSELTLMRAGDPAANTALPAATDAPGDLRLVLRGVGGDYHGRSITLERPRLVGRAAEADIRIDSPAFPERHARLEHDGGRNHGRSGICTRCERDHAFEQPDALRGLGGEDGADAHGEQLHAEL